MKEIIYNYDNLKLDDIDETVKRSKIILENKDGYILLVKEFDAYQLPGGHLEPGENYNEALIREVKEEIGIDIENIERNPILIIRYLKKNFPKEKTNTEYIGYYFKEQIDIIPNIDNLNLTEYEQHSDYKIELIHKSNILEILNNNIKTTQYKNTVSDTIEAIKEYLK